MEYTGNVPYEVVTVSSVAVYVPLMLEFTIPPMEYSTSHVPRSLAVDAAVMPIVSASVAGVHPAAVTSTVSEAELSASGVPDRTPSEDRDSPEGNEEPEAMA